jgi:ABC-type sugar transport system substrate-binding protein
VNWSAWRRGKEADRVQSLKYIAEFALFKTGDFMFKRSTRFSALLALTVLLVTLVLGSVTAQDATTICFGFQDLETEFWVAGHRAITDTLRNQGVEVLEYNANEDPNRQLEQIRECIAAGVDGIIIIPQDGDSAVTIVNEAQAADVPIAVFNRPPNDRSRGIVVVADNVSAVRDHPRSDHTADPRRRTARHERNWSA